MKKFLFTLLILSPILTNAQFEKGDKYLGGTLSFKNTAPTNNNLNLVKSSNFSIVPNFGFMLNESLSLGGQLGYAGDKGKASYNGSLYDSKQSGFVVGMDLRKYFSITDNFLFALSTSASFYRSTITTTISTNKENKDQLYDVGGAIKPVFIFFPSRNWGIEASFGSLGYNFSRSLTSKQGGNNFNLDYGTLNFGFNYYFRGASN